MQPTLFNLRDYAIPDVPPAIANALAFGAALVISLSGGKDSDAMLSWVMKLRLQYGWSGKCYAIYCHLGQIEWMGAQLHIRKQCQLAGVELVVLEPPMDMIGIWQARWDKLISQGRANTIPFWSSRRVRYCTDIAKIIPSNHELMKHELAVCAIGIRAQESEGRKHKAYYSVRNETTTKCLKTPAKLTAIQQEAHAEKAWHKWQTLKPRAGRKPRLTYDWYPLFDRTVDDVWALCGTNADTVDRRRALFRSGRYREAFEGFPANYAYITGSTRYSCSLCTLASAGDIANGGRMNPWNFLDLLGMEQRSGMSFQQNLSLESLAPFIWSMSWDERREIFKILRELDLIEEFEWVKFQEHDHAYSYQQQAA